MSDKMEQQGFENRFDPNSKVLGCHKASLSVAKVIKKVIYLWKNVGNNSAAHDRNPAQNEGA